MCAQLRICRTVGIMSERGLVVIQRWWIYIWEGYLPVSRIAACMLLYIGVMFLYQAQLDRSPLVLTPDMLPGVTTLVLMFLYYRIQDEFKDRETDRTFFPHRPVPSGRVTLADLTALIWVDFAALFALNFLWGGAIGMFLVFFCFSLLMHKWFFLEKTISQNRLLALATHGPFGFISNLFVVAIFANRYNTALLGADGILAALWFSLGGFYWDIGRKTRAPHEEMQGYQTYSSIIGQRGASALALGFVCLQGLLLVWLPVSRLYIGGFALLTLACAAFFGGFLLKPERGSKHLQLATEVFSCLVMLGMIIDLAVSRGVAWTR